MICIILSLLSRRADGRRPALIVLVLPDYLVFTFHSMKKPFCNSCILKKQLEHISLKWRRRSGVYDLHLDDKKDDK